MGAESAETEDDAAAEEDHKGEGGLSLEDAVERIEALEAEKENLESSVDALEEEVEALTDRLARARADHANYKKRVGTMKDEAARDARIEMVRILVDVLDNVDRALDAGPSPEVKKGLELVTRTVQEELDRVGVETIEPEEGDAFDPSVHEAVLMEPSMDHDAQTIIEVLGPGYELDNRQIRAAMVKVSTGPPENA